VDSHTDRFRQVPPGILTECKDLAETIRRDNGSLRYDKIQSARMRISSGFYDSGHVLSQVASRLIEDGALG
jgi:hypothetical protein